MSTLYHLLQDIKERSVSDTNSAPKAARKPIKGSKDMFKFNIKTKKKGLIPLLSFCFAVIFLLSSFTIISASAVQNKRDYSKIEVYLGGMPFGVKYLTEGVTVIGFSDIDGLSKNQNPAYLAGIRAKDVILMVDGKEIQSSGELTRAVEASDGRELSITYKRGESRKTVKVSPVYSANEKRYKTGLWVKDSGAGIGTVTYITTDNHSFGGLGHGICDGETGELVRMKDGDVMGVNVYSVKKGVSGAPGELRGHFCPEKSGILYGNTDCGVFGHFDKLPDGCGEKIKIAMRDEMHEGDAELVCTLADGVKTRYKIEIGSINKAASTSKCFVIKVKDASLIEKTGGIVQGMSGSPIIQDGKLVGAVTHVMINDPTTGYGIFIENMLNAANIPMAKAS